MLPAPRTASVDPVSAVLAVLRGRGLHPELVADACCGEPDRRIRTASPAGLVVELLCYDPPEPVPPRWLAVRITGDTRVVWRGPEVADPPQAVADFVEDLLWLPATALTGRYPALG